MKHSAHVHEGKRDMFHSNLVEGLWSVLKGYTRRIYIGMSGTNLCFERFLFEALWRRERKFYPKEER
jgi:hypothetical protein